MVCCEIWVASLLDPLCQEKSNIFHVLCEWDLIKKNYNHKAVCKKGGVNKPIYHKYIWIIRWALGQHHRRHSPSDRSKRDPRGARGNVLTLLWRSWSSSCGIGSICRHISFVEAKNQRRRRWKSERKRERVASREREIECLQHPLIAHNYIVLTYIGITTPHHLVASPDTLTYYT